VTGRRRARRAGAAACISSRRTFLAAKAHRLSFRDVERKCDSSVVEHALYFVETLLNGYRLPIAEE
jgi:hypothetical protein